jgi:hypothetical protein
MGNTTSDLNAFLKGKPAFATELYNHFISEYKKIGKIEPIPAKTMLGIFNGQKRIAYVTQFGKNFLHIVFMFPQEFTDNLCFQKIAQVPGQNQFNHHFRMLGKEDINPEVKKFMRMALKGEN